MFISFTISSAILFSLLGRAYDSSASTTLLISFVKSLNIFSPGTVLTEDATMLNLPSLVESSAVDVISATGYMNLFEAGM